MLSQKLPLLNPSEVLSWLIELIKWIQSLLASAQNITPFAFALFLVYILVKVAWKLKP